MMGLINYLTPVNTVTFLLLFIRIASFLSFMPFFSYPTIPMSAKAAFALWLSILLFPITPKVTFEINIINLFLAIMFETALAFFVGMALGLIFDILKYAAEQISFVMGFTLANVIDPNSGMNTNIIGQFFTWIAILVFFTFGGDRLEILLISKTLSSLPLGAIFDIHSFYQFFVVYMFKYFLFGIAMAFPVLAVSLLSDIIFGMIMKTMPQFNLLVVGFPIKIAFSFLILIAVLGSLMHVFSDKFIEAFNYIVQIIG
jgi:flagellar biosynthetic protein FliR